MTRSDLVAQLGSGWKSTYTQTLGELETGIWLADGQGGGSGALGLPAPLPNAEAGIVTTPWFNPASATRSSSPWPLTSTIV